MSLLKELIQDIKENINKAGYEVENPALEPSNRKDLGEYQLNDAMQLAKQYHENPREIAEKIASVAALASSTSSDALKQVDKAKDALKSLKK